MRDENDAIICKLVANEPANASRICQCVNCHDDLLDACKKVIECAPKVWGEDTDDWPKFTLRLERAIAKAEGKE